MQTLDAWLAEMPSDEEVERQIAATERRLQLLKVIRDLQRNGSVSVQTTENGNGHGGNGRQSKLTDTADETATFDPARISHERRQIIEAMLTCPGRAGGPQLVQKKLAARGVHINEKALQTNMARMYRFNLLARPRQGHYKVPPAVAAYVQGGEVVTK